MKRKIIKIDEEKCNGCGLCIPRCPEGAIQLIDGKARLISDLFCDGLGACLGECPQGAITVEEREAQPYDERKVMENIVRQGKNVIKAHLEHLQEHRQDKYLEEALSFLNEKGIANPLAKHDATGKNALHAHSQAERPRARSRELSQLTHWPIQLHLISPLAPQYRGKDVLLAADCVAYALDNFHSACLRNKALAIACPKLDQGQEIYVEKIRGLVNEARINTLTVMIMEVPCCRGLLKLAQQALADTARKTPLKRIVISLEGEARSEEWV